MKAITEWLYCGSDADVDEFRELFPQGRIVHAAKEPWHREALGYTGRGAPKDSPEYLIAVRDDELILNLVDAADKKWIAGECFDAAVEYIDAAYDDGVPVLVHCNQGGSRGPGIIFYWMYCTAEDSGDFENTVDYFTEEMYEDFNPGAGVRAFLEEKFNG